MRIMHIPVVTSTAARHEAPWAAKLVKVTGGWLAFETLADYRAWVRHRPPYQDPVPRTGTLLDTTA